MKQRNAGRIDLHTDFFKTFANHTIADRLTRINSTGWRTPKPIHVSGVVSFKSENFVIATQHNIDGQIGRLTLNRLNRHDGF